MRVIISVVHLPNRWNNLKHLSHNLHLETLLFFCYRSCFLLLVFFFKLLWSTLFVCENLSSLWHNLNALTSSVRVGVESCKLMNFCSTNTQTTIRATYSSLNATRLPYDYDDDDDDDNLYGSLFFSRIHLRFVSAAAAAAATRTAMSVRLLVRCNLNH